MRLVKPALIALGLATALPALAAAQAADPASQPIDSLDRALIAAMKEGKAATVEQRYARLSPTVQRAFNLPRMIRIASGAAWAKMSADEQAALTKAFTRFSIATYARNFSGYSGQKFVIDKVDTRLPDKLVRTKLVNPDGSSVILAYRMQASGGEWKILDVYFNGSISSLAQQSSDFASTLRSGGAPALAKKLNDQADALLRGS